MCSSAPSPVLSSLPSHYSSSAENDSFSLSGFEPLAVYTAAEGFMLRFYNLAGLGEPHLHTYTSKLQTHTLLTALQVWRFDYGNGPGVRGRYK